MIAAIGSNNMLPKMTAMSNNVMARKGMSEEANESISERMAEAQQPSSAKMAKTQNPTNSGNKIDLRV